MKKQQLNLEEIRQEAQKFYIARETEEYLHLSGQKTELQLSEIYETYQHLFSKDTIGQLIEFSKQQGASRRIDYLISFLMRNYLGRSVKELRDEIATRDAQATIEVDGETVSYRQAERLIANTADPIKRDNINQKRNEILRQHNVMRKEMIEREHEMVRELDYDSYASLWNKIDALRLDRLEKRIEDFLNQTEPLYVRSLDNLMQKYFQIPLQEMNSWDIQRVARAPQFDPFFPGDGILDTLKSTVKQMGIDFDKQGILLDLQARKTKSGTPFSSAIEVPNRVILVMATLEGYYAYKGLFHEAGHAIHHSSVLPCTPFEYACVVSGDFAIPETFATLFEFLLFDSQWLHTYTDMTSHQEFVGYFGTVELYKIRRYCGKLLYEIRLHSADKTDSMDNMDGLYTNLMSDAVKCHVPAERYLLDLHPPFHSAGYLQAWMCYAHLREYLKNNYGDAWSNNPKAGVFLREIWAVGQKYKAWELVQQLGYEDLDIAPLVNYMEELLGSH